MVARLELKLKCREALSYQMASLFHGVLMELLPEEYADELHYSQLHPYTQHLECREDVWYWVVCALNEQAVKIILKDALWDVKQIVLKKKQILIEICGKQYEEMPYKQFMEHFYHEEHGRYLQIQFVSPTAFKQRGNYVFFPDLHCLFQSLMNKYDAAAGHHIMLDEETLEQLCANAQIVRYDLKSVSFSLEGVRIPSFIGKITIRMNGTKTMAGFANMLIEFGTFSGVGIKTSLGMGYIRQIKERR